MRLYLLLIVAAVVIAFCDGFLFLSMDGASLSTEVTAVSVERLKTGFRAANAPLAVLDLNALYPEKENRELLDPAAALPQTTRFPLAQIEALFRFAHSCEAKEAAAEADSGGSETAKSMGMAPRPLWARPAPRAGIFWRGALSPSFGRELRLSPLHGNPRGPGARGKERRALSLLSRDRAAPTARAPFAARALRRPSRSRFRQLEGARRRNGISSFRAVRAHAPPHFP